MESRALEKIRVMDNVFVYIVNPREEKLRCEDDDIIYKQIPR